MDKIELAGVGRLQILVDNTCSATQLKTEHGFSAWIRYGGHQFLFDTGAGNALRPNAEQLGIALQTAEAILLSHGHYDHGGGLNFPELRNKPIYLHPEALRQRYSLHADGSWHDISLPQDVHHMLQTHNDLHWTRDWTQIIPGLWLTGYIPRRNDFEDAGGNFFLDQEEGVADDVPDDQSAVLETGAGLVALTGCAHSGVCNLIQKIETKFGAPPHTIIGGLHLKHASPERMQKTCEVLKSIPQVYPLHCSGSAVSDWLKKHKRA